MRTYEVKFDYAHMSAVMGLLKGKGLSFRDQNFEMRCSLVTDVRLDEAIAFENDIKDIDGAKFTLLQEA